MSATRVVPVLKSRLVTPGANLQAVRSISSTASLSKGPVEAVKDTLKKADQAVSGAAVKGIDKGGMFSSPLTRPLKYPLTRIADPEQAREKAKEAMHMSSGEAKSKMGDAAQYAGQAEAKAEKAAGQAKGKAHEAAGEMKGKAKEAKHNTVG